MAHQVMDVSYDLASRGPAGKGNSSVEEFPITMSISTPC